MGTTRRVCWKLDVLCPFWVLLAHRCWIRLLTGDLYVTCTHDLLYCFWSQWDLCQATGISAVLQRCSSETSEGDFMEKQQQQQEKTTCRWLKNLSSSRISYPLSRKFSYLNYRVAKIHWNSLLGAWIPPSYAASAKRVRNMVFSYIPYLLEPTNVLGGFLQLLNVFSPSP